MVCISLIANALLRSLERTEGSCRTHEMIIPRLWHKPRGDLESTQTALDDKSLAFNSLNTKLDGLQAQHSRTIEELQKAHDEKQNFQDGNAIASKELKDQLASMARLLQGKDAELGSSSKAYATELQRLQTSNAKVTEEFESRQRQPSDSV